MKKYLIIAYCIVFSKLLFSQTEYIDSLKSENKLKVDVFKKMDNLHLITSKSTFVNLDTAEKYGNILLKLSVSKQSKDHECKAYHSLADVQRRRSNYDSAIFLAYKSLAIVQDSIQKIKIYNAIGNIYFNNDKYDEALAYYQKVEKLSAQENSPIDLYMNYNNMGMVYVRKGDYQKGLDVNYKSLNVIDSLDLDVRTGSIYGVIGVIYQNMSYYEKSYENYKKAIFADSIFGDKMGVITWEINWAIALQNENKFDESKKLYLSSLDKCKKEGYLSLVANVLCNIGSLMFHSNQLDSASYYFKKAYILSDSINAKHLYAFSIRNLGEIYLKQNKPILAKPFIEKGYNLAYELQDISFIRDIHFTWSGYYEQLNNLDSAYHHFKQYTIFKDSILGESNQVEIGKLEAKHDYDRQKIFDDKENEKRLALEKQKQEQQKIIILITSTSIAFVLILLVIIYRRLKLTRKQKRIIEEQKEEVETQRDQIENQKLLIEIKHSEIQESISYAKRIQEAILPQFQVLEQSFNDVFILYKPKDVVAGDFYWFEENENFKFIAVADCTGHGVPGAMVSVVCHGALNRCVREYNLAKPSEILDKTRELVLNTFDKSKEQVKDGMDICLCVFNKENQTLEFAGANNPLYLLKNNQIEIIKGDKQPIGYDSMAKPFTNHIVDLKNVERIYLFSDGFPDQFGGENEKKIGYSKFRELLLENKNQNMTMEQNSLDNFFEVWKKNEEQIDDVCIIGIKLEKK